MARHRRATIWGMDERVLHVQLPRRAGLWNWSWYVRRPLRHVPDQDGHRLQRSVPQRHLPTTAPPNRRVCVAARPPRRPWLPAACALRVAGSMRMIVAHGPWRGGFTRCRCFEHAAVCRALQRCQRGRTAPAPDSSNARRPARAARTSGGCQVTNWLGTSSNACRAWCTPSEFDANTGQYSCATIEAYECEVDGSTPQLALCDVRADCSGWDAQGQLRMPAWQQMQGYRATPDHAHPYASQGTFRAGVPTTHARVYEFARCIHDDSTRCG